MHIERRALAAELVAKGRRLEGYAAVYGAEAQIRDYTETIAPGAFQSTLAESKDILALADHDPTRLLARTKNRTLRLLEDTRGLHFDLDVPPTSVGHDVLALAERGDLGGASFAFTTRKDGDHWDGDKRELRSVTLHEISIVSSWPAYPQTLVQARARLSPTGPTRYQLARRFLDSIS
jgi:HK97 family phage prohead protease